MPRFHRSILLYNGKAGSSTGETLLPLTVPALAAASKHLELIQTETQEELEEACRLASHSADAIFIAGGDGTIHTVVQILANLENPPILGILPSGTCNDFARTLNIPLPLNEAVEALISGDIQQVDSALINNRSFLNFAGIGLIADASLNIDPELKERYGKLSYFMSALQTMRQSSPFPVQLVVDGIHYTEEAEAVLVMNGKSIGTHMFPMSGISPFDGLLDIFVIQSASLAAIREWFSLSREDVYPDELEHIAHYQGKSISIRTEEEMQVDTDGEIYLTTPLDIRVQPKNLRMLLPKTLENTQL